MNNLCLHVFVLHMYASVLSFRKLLKNATQLPSWAKCVFLGSTVASETKLYRMSSSLLLDLQFPWQTNEEMLGLGIEFYICFYQLPFPTGFSLITSSRKSSITIYFSRTEPRQEFCFRCK